MEFLDIVRFLRLVSRPISEGICPIKELLASVSSVKANKTLSWAIEDGSEERKLKFSRLMLFMLVTPVDDVEQIIPAQRRGVHGSFPGWKLHGCPEEDLRDQAGPLKLL